MKNAAPPVGLEPTTFVALSSAHRAIHLHHGYGGLGKTSLYFIAMY